MFKCTQQLIILTSLIMMSCFTPTTKQTENINDVSDEELIERIDSLLKYADVEIENITHINEESQIEHNLLVSKIAQLSYELSEQKKLIIDNEVKYKDIVDSLNLIIENKEKVINQRDYIINVLDEKTKRERKECEKKELNNTRHIDRLDSTINVLQDSIIKMNLIIIENIKQNKLEKLMIE